MLVNLDVRLTQDEPLLKEGYAIARQQFVLTDYQFPTAEDILKTDGLAESVQKDEMKACLTLSAAGTSVTFNKSNGWIDYLDIAGRPMLQKGYSIKPDFWRAPTDNDYGAGLQRNFAAWKNPSMNLKSFACTDKGQNKEVVAVYEMPGVDAKLTMTYTLTAKGELLVNEALDVNENAKNKPNMMRFGMQLVMPEEYNMINYKITIPSHHGYQSIDMIVIYMCYYQIVNFVF